jgi:hypothetical protein
MSPLAAMPAIAPALGSPRVVSGRAARPARASTVAVASLPARERVAALSAAVAVALSLGAPPSALAKLVNVTVDPATLTTRVCADPRAGGVPGTATYKAKCMEIVGVATNPSKERVYNADVYGSVRDAANDDVLNSGRVGSIAQLEPGPNDFTLRLTVATSQPLPLKLKNFKAQGVTTVLNASPNPYDDYTEFDDFGAQK